MDVAARAPMARQNSTRFLWLDLTRKCQLECTHCYNASGPDGTHGSMTRRDWNDVLDQCTAADVRAVQFIGGEPTMHPDFTALVDRALSLGLDVEVYSNLVRITEECWTLFQREGLSLATSYYSSRAEEHNGMTRRPSHGRTRQNIERALRLGIPLRVGVIGAGEAAEVAQKELQALGVTRTGVDDVRPFGRGGRGRQPDPAALCGRCGADRAAVGPTGEVSPCVFSDWLGVGNVRVTPLVDILTGTAMAAAQSTIGRAQRAEGSPGDPCYPTATPCSPGRPPCAPRGDLPAACAPDDVECRPGFPSTHCNPRR